jgi:hypothetical protein
MMASSQHGTEKNTVHTDDADVRDVAVGELEPIDERTELRAWTWSTFCRSVLLQMVFFGLSVIQWSISSYTANIIIRLSLVGPAMSDAITNLGGGGLSTPWLANLSTCLNYVCGFICTLFGGPLINKIGIKWSCMIAAITMPLHGSSFYVNATQGTEWYLLLGNVSRHSEC